MFLQVDCVSSFGVDRWPRRVRCFWFTVAAHVAHVVDSWSSFVALR
jgi:hypothetical protein